LDYNGEDLGLMGSRNMKRRKIWECYKDLGRLGKAVRGVAWALGKVSFMLCLSDKNKAEKENQITPLWSTFGRARSRVCECASCKLSRSFVDDSIAFPSELELLHGLAGQRGSEAPGGAFGLLPCNAHWAFLEGLCLCKMSRSYRSE
jgi:hypothetical protein